MIINSRQGLSRNKISTFQECIPGNIFWIRYNLTVGKVAKTELGEKAAKHWPKPTLPCVRAILSELRHVKPVPYMIQLVEYKLSGPASDQDPKDANSEDSYCRSVFVRDFLSSRRQTPKVWNFCVFVEGFWIFVPAPEKLPSLPGTEIQIFCLFVSFVFCGHRLSMACLKAPTLTRSVGDAVSNKP